MSLKATGALPLDRLGTILSLAFAGVACEVGWRSDGGELIVAGRSDAKGDSCSDGLGDGAAASRVPTDGKESVALDGAIIDPAFRPLSLDG